MKAAESPEREPVTLPAVAGEVSMDLFNQLRQQADVLLKTGFLPAHLKTPEQAVAVALIGRELRVPMMQALRKIYVIQGTPCLASELMLALAQRTRQVEDLQISDDGEACTVTLKRRGRKSPVTTTFSMADAKGMRLDDKDNWKKQAPVMRRWRAISACVRLAFPDATGGMYSLEEIAPEIQVNERGEPVGPVAPARPPAESLMPRRIEQGGDGTKQVPAAEPVPTDLGGAAGNPRDARSEVAAPPTAAVTDAEMWAAFLGEPETGAPVDTAPPPAVVCPKCGAEITARRLGFLHCESCHIMFEPPVQPAERETVGDPVVEGARQPLGGNQSAPHTEPGPGETFEIAGTPYRTAGITKDLLMKAFKFSEQLDQLEGKGTAMNILGTECGVESRTELTKEQGQKYIALLTKRVNQALARHGQRKQA